MLQCHVKGCSLDNYPLGITDAQLGSVETEFNEKFIRKIIPRLDWNALTLTVAEVSALIFITLAWD